MERIYAPWRIEYVVGNEKEEGCIFCTKPAQDNDDENLIVHRAEAVFTIMNKFPYNNGHLMVCPYRHVSDVCDLSPRENYLMMEEVCRAIQVIRDVMKAAGFNVGLNLGTVAGAGIDEHLHFHVVPRWHGDTNVMPVLAEVKVIPEHFRATSRKLRDGFHRLFPEVTQEVKE